MFYSNSSGAGTIALVILAFIAGYWVRDTGYSIRVVTPSSEVEG